ncbi:9512_t:CDS:1 [Funneliformis geosporum]|uniref:15756_t:CDS:1 n=1 Tax=Funneliformis geosporum TaxID=1117311 RepID=A0A9W4SQ07_9GLOM|nr:9512_t:CDS:1 [Funneliformis geosporum]CAI2177419.1 15756_t:CDS:1 [Funneliformis geosporum]
MSEDNVDQKNISVPLPADCVYEIIQYLVNDVKTLQSCVTINQTFCQVIIPILWSNPFKFIQDKEKRGIIIRTYFSCLDEQEKNQITTFLHKSVVDFPRPFINYPSFLQDFELFSLQESMRVFLRQFYSVSPTDNRINSIIRILNPFIGKLFFNDQSNFKYMNVNLRDTLGLEKNQLDMSSYGEVLERVLSNIDKFSFGFRLDIHKKPELFTFIKRNADKLTNIISQHNKNIQHVSFSFACLSPYLRQRKNKLKKLNISIEYDRFIEILNNFIISLNNLKSLEIPCYWRHNEFVKLFKNHSHSLTYLKLHEIFNCSIVLDILNNCPNLKTIELVSFTFYDNKENISIFEKPITSNLNNLENLYMTIPSNYYLAFKLFEKIVSTSNNNLKTLFFNKQQYYYSSFNDFNNITQLIQPFCTNLTHLFIKIVNERGIILFLKNLRRLIHLKLGCFAYNNLKVDDITELARSFSPTLKILEIDAFITEEMLKVLLQEGKCNLNELYIKANLNETILRIIMDYARQRNSLKTFRYSNDGNQCCIHYPSPQLLEEAKNLFTIDDNPEPFTTPFVKSIF